MHLGHISQLQVAPGWLFDQWLLTGKNRQALQWQVRPLLQCNEFAFF